MDKMNKEKEKSIGKKIKDLIKGNVKMYLCWLFLLGLGMLIISGIFEARYEKTVQSKIYQAYDEEENLQQDIYKALNGDGWADALFTSAMELPIV